MAKQTINVGSVANDGTGDAVRSAFQKTNANFDELYTQSQTASADVPASASATGTAGQIAYNADYFYVCVATDTWKRAALSTW